jgi:hypothetical protein
VPKGHDILSTLGSNFTMISTLKMINAPKVVFDLPIIKIVILMKEIIIQLSRELVTICFFHIRIDKKIVAHHSFNYDITHEPSMNHNLGDKTEVETEYVFEG